MFKIIIAALAFALSSFSCVALAAPVNINTADAATLDAELVGVGPVVAQRIIDFRATNGRFSAPDQLTLVKGIGPKTLERNAADIQID